MEFSKNDLQKLGLKQIVRGNLQIVKSELKDNSKQIIVKINDEANEINPNYVLYKLGKISFEELRVRG